MNKTYEDKINRAEEIYNKRKEERLRSNISSSYNNINQLVSDNKNNFNNSKYNVAEYNIRNRIPEELKENRNNVYNMNDYINRYNEDKIKNENKKTKRKLLKTIWILLNIYIIFMMIQYRNEIFLPNISRKIDSILEYNINVINTCKSCIYKDNNENKNEINSNLKNNQNDFSNNEEKVNDENVIDTKQVDNIDANNIEKQKNELETKSKILSDLKEDSVVPVVGKITSEYGEREVLSNVMSKDHKGIDIGANYNTPIIAAMQGTIIDARYSNSYGNMIKVKNIIDDKTVINLYAHCKDIYVHINDWINKGQEIATVGSTGNSTGPHLHYEVIYEGEYINPREVLNI